MTMRITLIKNAGKLEAMEDKYPNTVIDRLVMVWSKEFTNCVDPSFRTSTSAGSN